MSREVHLSNKWRCDIYSRELSAKLTVRCKLTTKCHPELQFVWLYSDRTRDLDGPLLVFTVNITNMLFCVALEDLLLVYVSGLQTPKERHIFHVTSQSAHIRPIKHWLLHVNWCILSHRAHLTRWNLKQLISSNQIRLFGKSFSVN